MSSQNCLRMHDDRENDSSAKQEFLHHNAGADGFGGSSYIDDVVFRDSDETPETGLETRYYYCQNWRHDVVALVSDVGELIEQVRYSPYGVPFGYPTGDTNSDGDWDAADAIVIGSLGSYDVRKDANLDGVVNSSDVTHANSITGGYQTLGRTVLTSTGVESILGYAGYVHDAKLAGAKWHVRYRVLDSELGRWLTRDPAGYLDGTNLYGYTRHSPLNYVDSQGLCAGPVRWDATVKRCRCVESGRFVESALCCVLPEASLRRVNGKCECTLPGGVKRIVPMSLCRMSAPDDDDKDKDKKKKKKKKKKGGAGVDSFLEVLSCAEEYSNCLENAESDYLRCYGTCASYRLETRDECYELCDEIYGLDVAACTVEYLACGLRSLCPF